MPDINSEILIPDIITQAWSKYANPETNASQFRYFFSILDEIESLLNVDKFSILSLDNRDTVSSEVHNNGDKALTLKHLEQLFESCSSGEVSLMYAVEKAIRKKQAQEIDVPTSIPLDLHLENPQDRADSIPSVASTFHRDPLDSSTPLSVNKVRNYPNKKIESRWEKSKRRSVSSVTLTPRNYQNLGSNVNGHGGDDDDGIEEDEQEESLRREISILMEDDRQAPNFSPTVRSRVASAASSIKFYSNQDNDSPSLISLNENGENDANNSFGSMGSRRGSRKFLNHKRSVKDVRTISQLNDHISFLEDSIRHHEDELKDKNGVVVMLDKKCRELDKKCKEFEDRVNELEQEEKARAKQIDEVENVVKMTQQEMKHRRQRDSRASEAFTNTLLRKRGDENDGLDLDESNRRKSTGGVALKNKMLNNQSESNGVFHGSDLDALYSDTKENHNRPSTAPSNPSEESKNLNDDQTAEARPHSEGSPKKYKKGHRPSSSSVFSVSPEETATDYDIKLAFLDLDSSTTTYLKELFRSSQQKVINIVYNQLNELKDLNTKLNEAEAQVKYFMAANEQLNVDYTTRLQQIEEFEQRIQEQIEKQMEEKYKSESQELIQQQVQQQIQKHLKEQVQKQVREQVREQVTKIKENNTKERAEEQQALEAQFQKRLREQVQQQANVYMNQIHTLKAQIETQQLAQQELEHQLQILGEQGRGESNLMNGGGKRGRSLEDELNAAEAEDDESEDENHNEETETFGIKPTISNNSLSHSSMHTTPNYATLSLPTDEEGNLDFSTFLEKIVVPMANEQGVFVKNLDHFQNSHSQANSHINHVQTDNHNRLHTGYQIADQIGDETSIKIGDDTSLQIGDLSSFQTTDAKIEKELKRLELLSVPKNKTISSLEQNGNKISISENQRSGGLQQRRGGGGEGRLARLRSLSQPSYNSIPFHLTTTSSKTSSKALLGQGVLSKEDKKKLLGNMTVPELAKYEYEQRKNRQKLEKLQKLYKLQQDKEKLRNGASFRLFGFDLFGGNGLLMIILVIVAIVGVLWLFGINVLNNIFNFFKPSTSTSSAAISSTNSNTNSLASNSIPCTDPENYLDNLEDSEGWWMYLPGSLRKVGNWVDQFARPEQPPPV